jgi:hypothetical protein
MEIQDYRDQCDRLIHHFSSQSYPAQYLNYCWILWKKLDAKDLKDLVDKMLAENRACCLSIESAKVWNMRMKSQSLASKEEAHGYEFLMKKYKAKNIFELVELMKNKNV